MSRIAVIDTAVDNKYIGGKAIERINLCKGSDNSTGNEISHGTLCAMILSHFASDYKLVNIQILRENKAKAFGGIGLLAEALRLCLELNVDVVSLSAVSSILSDSKYIYETTCELAKGAFIVSALDNAQYVSVPTSYPHVVGVRCDTAGLLSPGELAYSAGDPFGANVYANCDFALLREHNCGPSNSFAVPVVVAYVNDLLNRGKSRQEIKSMLRNLKPYPISDGPTMMPPLPSEEREIPVVYLANGTSDMCREIMDCLYENHKVQSSTLSLLACPYDIRIKTVKKIDAIHHDLRFM